MVFSVKVTDYEKKIMLNICDANLLGKKIVQGELIMNISEPYYGDRFVEQDEAETLLKRSSIINMAGKETTELSIKLGVGSKNAVKLISDIPFLIVFNI